MEIRERQEEQVEDNLQTIGGSVIEFFNNNINYLRQVNWKYLLMDGLHLTVIYYILI